MLATAHGAFLFTVVALQQRTSVSFHSRVISFDVNYITMSHPVMVAE